MKAHYHDNPFGIYQPYPARIVGILPECDENHKLFQIRFEDDEVAKNFKHKPGQFLMLSVIGTGEAPFSIISSPTQTDMIEVLVRRVGRVTNALFSLQPNSLIGIRGPLGNGFPVEEMEGNSLLIIAGGIGMAALRSLLLYALDRRSKFKDITLIYGSKSPKEMLLRQEIMSLKDKHDINCLLTVDSDPEGGWTEHIGLVTDMFDHLEDVDPENTYAAICGPPVMYKFVLDRLLKLNFPKDRILMSFERHMKCGVGKCGHCRIGHKYTCLDGPVFTYWDVINMPEVIHD